MSDKAFISDFSIASPIGNSKLDFEKNIFNSLSGVVSSDSFLKNQDVPIIPIKSLALLDETKLLTNNFFKSKSIDQKFTRVLAHLAIELIRFSPDKKIDGLILGIDGTNSDSRNFEKFYMNYKHTVDRSFINYAQQDLLNILSEYLIHLGFEKIRPENIITINNTCISGISALAIAQRMIRQKKWNRAVVGSIECITDIHSLVLLHSIGALSTRNVEPQQASCPFSMDRDGFVKGEGGALFLVESENLINAQNTENLFEILGTGQTSDGYRLTDGRSDVMQAARAINICLLDSNIKPSEIDYINLHGTSTVMNDFLETQTIKSVFQNLAKNIPMSSLKSKIGHCTIASASIEIAASLLMLKNNMMSPTLNLNIPDPKCDLDYIPNFSRQKELNIILKTAFGLGGQNAAIAIKKI